MVPTDLLKFADTAMYQAKEMGRDNFQFFAPAMNVRAVERQSVEEGMRRLDEWGRMLEQLPPLETVFVARPTVAPSAAGARTSAASTTKLPVSDERCWRPSSNARSRAVT